MGPASWICVAPKALDERLNQRSDDEPEFLVVIDACRHADKYRLMNIFEEHKAYSEMAANEGKMVIYFGFKGIDRMNGFVFTNILQEIAAYYHIELTKMCLDIAELVKDGAKLADIPGLELRNVNGGIVNFPDSVIYPFGGLKIPSINISGQWESISLTELIIKTGKDAFPRFDPEKIIHSETGKLMCEGFEYEYYYTDPDHPEVAKRFEQMGLCVERHNMKGDQWYSVASRQALEEGKSPGNALPGKKLPLLLCLVEVSAVIPHRVLTCFSNYLEYMKLAASGELMLAMFALEDVDSNEKMFDIYEEMLASYPVDSSRVYLTGFSHNSQLAIDLCWRHRNKLAGFAACGHKPWLAHPRYSPDSVKVTDGMIEDMRNCDMPTINICGLYENNYFRQDTKDKGFADLVDGWQRRLKAHNCRVQTPEEIAAAQSADNYITQNVGLPADRQDIEYLFGLECFINDYKNTEGKSHLRLAVIGENIHTYTPQMAYLTWNYLRRFSRDLKTGRIAELY
jgi:hypothetical protein